MGLPDFADGCQAAVILFLSLNATFYFSINFPMIFIAFILEGY